jgi:hypothetical protein
MPGDIIPYKALSLIVFIHILVSYHLDEIPALEIAERWDFSYQLIYCAIRTFHKHMNNVRQHIREISPEGVPAAFDACGVLALIKEPLAFQSSYIEKNSRACFMCKIFYKKGAPPVGALAPQRA